MAKKEQANVSNIRLREHLAEMMERLLDPECVDTPEKAQQEIAKATAMRDLVAESVNIQRVEIEGKRVMVDALKIMGTYGLTEGDMKLLGIEEN